MTQWAYFAARDGDTTRGEVTAPDEDEARRLAFHEIAKAFRLGWALDIAACGEDWDYFQGELDGFELDEEPPQDPLTAAAPAMLAALQSVARVMDMSDPESDNFAESAADCLDALLNDCSDVVSILQSLGLPLDGSPGTPTGGTGAPAASPTVEAGADLQTFTAFCQSSDGTGTVWIDTVQAPDLQSAIGEARQQCAIAWGCEIPFVHCLGIAAGDVEILQWDDLNDD